MGRTIWKGGEVCIGCYLIDCLRRLNPLPLDMILKVCKREDVKVEDVLEKGGFIREIKKQGTKEVMESLAVLAEKDENTRRTFRRWFEHADEGILLPLGEGLPRLLSAIDVRNDERWGRKAKVRKGGGRVQRDDDLELRVIIIFLDTSAYTFYSPLTLPHPPPPPKPHPHTGMLPIPKINLPLLPLLLPPPNPHPPLHRPHPLPRALLHLCRRPNNPLHHPPKLPNFNPLPPTNAQLPRDYGRTYGGGNRQER